jgi:MFS family permease
MRRRGLIGLLVAVGVSSLGTRMSFLALPWFVLSTTGSAVQTGLVAAAELTPYVLVQGLGGPVVDRLGAWRLSMVTDLGAAIAIAVIPVLHTTGRLNLPTLAILVAVGGALRGAGDASRDVLLPGVGELARTALERSAGLFDGVGRGASLIGAPLAGALIVISSPLVVLVFDAATFALSALVVGLLVPKSAQPAPSAQPELNYLGSLGVGFRYLLGDRLLLGIGTMVLVTNLLDQAGSSVLLPVWSRQITGSPVALGVLGAVFSAGALIGNFVVTWRGPRMPRRLTYGWGFLIASGPRFLALAVASSVSPLIPLFLLCGCGAGGINPILGAVEYERIPRHLQARVLGALGATAWAGIPAGTLAGGVASDSLGIRGALLITGALYLLTTLAPFVFPSWREMDVREKSDTVASDMR